MWLHENGAFQKRCRHYDAMFSRQNLNSTLETRIGQKISYQIKKLVNFSLLKQYLRQQSTKVTTVSVVVWALVTKVSCSRLLDRFQKRISVDGWKTKRKRYKNASVDAYLFLHFHKVKTMRFQKRIRVVQALVSTFPKMSLLCHTWWKDAPLSLFHNAKVNTLEFVTPTL